MLERADSMQVLRKRRGKARAHLERRLFRDKVPRRQRQLVRSARAHLLAALVVLVGRTVMERHKDVPASDLADLGRALERAARRLDEDHVARLDAELGGVGVRDLDKDVGRGVLELLGPARLGARVEVVHDAARAAQGEDAIWEGWTSGRGWRAGGEEGREQGSRVGD